MADALSRSALKELVRDFVHPEVTEVINTPGSGNWTVPAGVYDVTVECRGAGAAGRASTLTAGAPAGGAGGYARSTVPVTPGDVIPYTVGAGGISNATPGSEGDGGDTSFGSPMVVLAKGGDKAADASIGGRGGVDTEGIGQDRGRGGNGGNSSGTPAGGAGGGGAAGIGANGLSGDPAGASPGAGGSGGGGGGDGGAGGAGAAGVAGNAPGGGGGGGGAGTHLGGDGAAGSIIRTYQST